MRSKALALAAILLLAGCQGRNGISTLEVEFYPDGTLRTATVIDGKERADIELRVNFASGGSAIYKAKSVAAFDGQKIEAEVRKQALETIRKGAEAVTESVLKGVLP